MSARERIAVIGAGAAGLTSAYLLQQRFDVTLFERDERLGGHVNTVPIPDGSDAGTPVDTGFIVFNERNYPNFCRLLDRLGVAWRESDMSFSYTSEISGLQYAGTGADGLFAQRANLVSPRFWRLLAAIMLFCRRGRQALKGKTLGNATLGDFLDECAFSDVLAADYVIPMAASIWSASRTDIRDFPAAAILHFFDNHGLLDVRDRITWRTVEGGSKTYVDALLGSFSGEVVTGARIAAVQRGVAGPTLQMEDGHTDRFDHVVLATHADQALALLEDPCNDETSLLGAWRYSRSLAVLHTDTALLPSNSRAWASWNYRRTTATGDAEPVHLSYHMNQLQGLATEREYIVTLNPPVDISPAKVIGSYNYTHPCYDHRSMATQGPLQALSGSRNTYYCGAYLGYGFHEDAVRSAVDVAAKFGVTL
ncbi:MAG: FAD-dependent oxidoreductase [Acidobacteria bacterium]|nr:FAD-dependent oxidoreductase [Acidobacteriota bacterium]